MTGCIHDLRHPFRRFRKQERGGILPLMLTGFVVCCMLAGLAVDVSDVYRQRERLILAADAAAQAGIVALSARKPATDVQAAALAAAETNAPLARVGRTNLGASDVQLVRFDPMTRKIVTGTPNAVQVTLRRDLAVSNPVRTTFLRFAGVDEFAFRVTSVAYYGQPGRCTSSDGIYAKGQVTLTSGNIIGRSYCVHSQTSVWLPQQNFFAAGSGVSMPNLAACKGKCVDVANPGIEAAVYTMNLNLPKVADHIQMVVDAMFATTSALKTQVFANKPLASDLQPLVTVKAATNNSIRNLVRGSVIDLTPVQFNDLMFNTSGAIPTGLVYHVDCRDKGNGASTSITIGGTTNRKNASLTTTTLETMRGIVLISDCAIDVGSNARIDNALVVTTRVSSSSVLSASEGAIVGDPLKNCDLNRKVYFLAQSGISVNSNFTASNVALVVNGNINVAANSNSSQVEHKGTSLHAEGSIQIPSSHTFNPCAEDTSGLLPGIRTFKFVIPKR